jgi:hypothetical protein
MIYQEDLSRCAGEVEARSDEGEGAANSTMQFAAQDGTVRLAAPSPTTSWRPLPRSGRG